MIFFFFLVGSMVPVEAGASLRGVGAAGWVVVAAGWDKSIA